MRCACCYTTSWDLTERGPVPLYLGDVWGHFLEGPLRPYTRIGADGLRELRFWLQGSRPMLAVLRADGQIRVFDGLDEIVVGHETDDFPPPLRVLVEPAITSLMRACQVAGASDGSPPVDKHWTTASPEACLVEAERREEARRRWEAERPKREEEQRRREQERERDRRTLIRARDRFMGLVREPSPRGGELSRARRRYRQMVAKGGIRSWVRAHREPLGPCYLCGGTAEALDHVVPLARGGSNLPDNLKPICRHCNSRKGAHLLSELDLSQFQRDVQEPAEPPSPGTRRIGKANRTDRR